MSKRKQVTCPTCGEPAERVVRDGQAYILCPAEDSIYKLTRTGARLAERGRLDEIEKRLAALEGRDEPSKAGKPKGKDKDDDENAKENGLEIVFGDDDEEGDAEDAEEDRGEEEDGD